ncbi:malate synthase A [Luteibaculum oceani]|uniref:Malate synthase n=1 Tax=Luteibaculum oceani TaxID=1294296 RepID=A0A5C6URL0_9FLAO|nr:malate synthase A [Luteibaculum oceani]TXC75639.1 malate synthase A [Luteibaculum oceani]
MDTTTLAIKVKETVNARQEEILSPSALEFLNALQQKFNQRRIDLLDLRKVRNLEFNKGLTPTFLPETKGIRASDWKVAPLPQDLLDRRVEITGPVDRKMIINALNSGAKCFMADFEDSTSPTWKNIVEGQINLYDAIRRQIDFTASNGKEYKLSEKPATLLVRPRGWHLEEKNLLDEQGNRFSASLVDFGLYFFHNAKQLIENGSGPYFYLPKLESHKEAALWNSVFVFAQDYLGIPQGTIKATVLIETLPAAFEMDEILYELREHSAGLNCGRWDYIFSFIKCFRSLPEMVLPNRDLVGMTAPFMDAYSKLAVKTCHKRGVHAMGGMSAFIPVKNDEAANTNALEKVRNDKTREVLNGHDGSWVAHPALVVPVLEIFDQFMPAPNQIGKQIDQEISAEDLLRLPEGEITEEGVRKNLNVGLLYVESWLRGRGAAALYNLMEDAATAEISRAQLWQWRKHQVKLADGRKLTKELMDKLFYEEQIHTRNQLNTILPHRLENAALLFRDLIFKEQFQDFLTLDAYELI